MTQGPRLEIIIDSRRAQRNTEELEDSLSDLEEQGDDTADSLRNVGDEANEATGKFASFRQQLQEIIGNTPIGGMINDVNEKLAALNGTAGVAAAGFAGLAVGGLALATTGLAALSIETAKADAELAVLANRANVSTQNFQTLQYAAEQLGMSQDGLGQSLADAQEKLGEFTASGGSGEAADFFEALKNNTKITDEQIQKLAKTLQGKDGVEALQIMKNKLDEIGASAQEQRFVFESLGNDLGNLLPIFANGGVTLNEFGKALEEAGIIKTKEAIEQSQMLTAQVKAAEIQYQGFKNQLVMGFTPAMVDVGNAMFGTSKNGVQLQQVGEGLGTVFKSVAHFAISTATAVEFLGNALGGVAAIGAQIASKANLTNLTPFGFAKATFDSRNEINAILKDMDEQSSNLVLASADRLDKLWSGGGTASKMVEVINNLNHVTNQNNEGLKTNAKEAKDSEKAALDASKARKQLADATERLNAQQEKSRSSIDYIFSDDFKRLNLDYQKQIQEINKANFGSEQEKYLKLARDRYDFNSSMYLRQITEEINSFKWSEERKLTYFYETQREIVNESGKYNDEIKALKLEAIDQQEKYELDSLKRTNSIRFLEFQRSMLNEVNFARDLIAKTSMTQSAYQQFTLMQGYQEAIRQTNMDELSKKDAVTKDKDLTDAEKYERLLQIEAAFQEKRFALISDFSKREQDLRTEQAQSTLNTYESIMGGLAGMLDKNSKEYAVAISVQRGIAVASATMAAWQAYTQAFADPTAMTLPQKFAGAASVLAAVMPAIQAINSARMPAYRNGGLVTGAGTGTSDSIIAKLSNGEHVATAWAVNKIGAENYDYMNRTGQLPPNRDDAQLNAIQRQQRQTNLINESVSQRNAASNQVQQEPPQVYVNPSIAIIDDRKTYREYMRSQAGQQDILYVIDQNRTKWGLKK
ncbi:hypothetical protein PY247_10650 [Acinetobacter proteolyticus]|nr:hypothetical protein [Acinetobacter proteolyticus]WEI20132.1 hypothetical protein PY247_10650 [Acinetobacter proteolyticus]